MLNKIIAFSLQNKLTILLFTLVVVIAGIFSMTRLPIDAVPDITNNQVQVFTITPSLAAQEVEQFLTAPIERGLASLPHLQEIRSLSRFGLSLITVVFDEEVDIYFARSLINQRLIEINDEIPESFGTPRMGPVSSGLSEIFQYTLEVEERMKGEYTDMELREIQDWIVARQLIGIKGVAEVNSFGGHVKQYEVSIDPLRLKSMQVSIPDVFDALERNNANTGGAYIERNSTAYYIRGVGMVGSFDDIGSIMIKRTGDGVPVLIRDVAEVGFGSAIRYGAMTSDGNGEVAGGIVLMLKDENSAKVVQAIKDRINVIETSLPEGIHIEPFLDRSDLVDRALNTVKTNLIEGALIVIFILVLFLGNLRAGLIVASVIPLSMLFALIMMNFFDVTGNLMSLGAIDFGLIVDGAVIIVESILHSIRQNRYFEKGIPKLSSAQMNEEVNLNASRMMNSATFGQIIILIVYIPILTLVGIEGKMFRPMAMTVSFAIAGALILSLTYVPVMSALFLPKNTKPKVYPGDRFINWLQGWYEPFLKKALSHRSMVVSVAVALFAGSIFMFSRMGAEFLPTLEEGDFAFHSMLPEGSTVDMSVRNNARVEKLLLEFPEVKKVVCKSGTAETPTDPMAPFDTDVIIVLKEKDEWTTTQDYQGLMDTMLITLQHNLPGVTFEATQPIEMRFNELMTGVRQDVAVKIFGENTDTLHTYAGKVAALLSEINGVQEPQVERTMGMPQISVEYDRERIARYGLNIKDLNMMVRTAFAGEKAGAVYENERKFDLVVRLDKDDRKDLEDVRELYIPVDDGEQIPLRQVAKIEYTTGTNQISREEAKRRIVIGFNVSGRDVKSVVSEAKEILSSKSILPPGYFFTFGGSFQHLEEATKRLLIAVPVALSLIFVILFITFRSIRSSLLIFSAIPMSTIGGIAALWLRDMPFSISAGIGFIALFGVAVLNGIVLISTFRYLEEDGITDITERIIKGTRHRLRPVLMTASVASLGFLPMALSTSAGAEVQRPLATVVIGGLITATLLTLVVLPALYMLFSGKSRMTQSVKAISLLLAFSATTGLANAQQNPVSMSIPLDSCISRGLEFNPELNAARLGIAEKKKLEKTAFDLGKTTLFYENEDQIKGVETDGILKIGFMQSIDFPTTWFADKRYNKQNTAIADQSYRVKLIEITQLIKSSYFELWTASELERIWKRNDSLFSGFESAAKLRYETGESNKLEYISATAKYSEIKAESRKAAGKRSIAQQELMKLLNTDTIILTSQGVPEKLSPLTIPESIVPTEHGYLSLSYQQIPLALYKKRAESHRMLPTLSLRYFNQSWYGEDPGFYGYSVGFGIPLFFWAQQGRIQAAKLNHQMAELGYANDRRTFSAEYQKAVEAYKNSLSVLSFYEEAGIAQAEQIESNAIEAFRFGEIGYIEFLTLFDQSMNLRVKYMESLNDYNQAVIRLNYFFMK
jgi:cobalt-zinc-cadmium resistance protein CzcA